MLFIDWKGASCNCDCTNLIYERSLMMIKYKNLSLFIIVSNYYQGNNNKRHIQLNCYEMHTSIWSRASSRASIFGFSTTQWSLFHQKYTIYSSIRKRNTMSTVEFFSRNCWQCSNETIWKCVQLISIYFARFVSGRENVRQYWKTFR